MSRPIRSALALAAAVTLLTAATVTAKPPTRPTVTFWWTGAHGDLVTNLNPGLDPTWASADGITDGTFAVAVHWPGAHIGSAVLHRIDGGDWASWSGNTVAWGIGVTRTATGPLVNDADSSFDLATNSKGWVGFFIHVDDDTVGTYFSHGSQFQLYVCADRLAFDCSDDTTITIP
jgi:hypothetical protein